jgi:uncharacterized protein (TIGR03435 family)
MNKPATFCLFTLALAAGAPAQAPRAAFEVVSVKLNTKCDPNGMSGGRATPGEFYQQCADLRDLILTAYGIYGDGPNPQPGSFRMQVTGGPAWMDSSRYDIAAKPAGNPPRSEMYGPMLQSLLEDRFKLKVRRETREGPVYLLSIAKSGPKLRPTAEGSCVITDLNHPANPAASSLPQCGKAKITRGPVITLDMPGATIADLATQLNLVMDRGVMDKTAITGRFDIHLEVTPADLQPKFLAGRAVPDPGQPASGEPDDGPSITTALEKQLGLKLSTGKGPVAVLVVEHIERPADN